ncbi:myopalladin isoform X2 [Platichthys flesus]|uniref:myopalladin isoform X2 n=1 Tax=Platichthys flesus TaxID=8260 RepID=UPI002DBF0036|nr:myopalladin isoform X2 [Platichthys flesus]
MQEKNPEQPPSLSQLLRESYLAEARAQQRHSEMSRSDASSTRLQIYGSLKGKAEDSVGRNDPQLPDLSAFLSQEELDKSVNLACQAIGNEHPEEKAEVKASVTPLPPSNISSVSVSSSTTPSVPFPNPSPAPLAAPSTVPFTQPAPVFKELPATHTITSERKGLKASTRQDNMIRNSRDSGEGINDFNTSERNAPYGPETQSKKEFLNKAADFIEELSSLFKANSSKRVRQRGSKSHRSRGQNKSQNDGTVDPLGSDNRERALMPVEEEERPSPAVSQTPEVQLDPGTGHVELQDCRVTEEQQYHCVSREEQEEQTETCALTETPSSAEPTCEPPHFIQKLKSREVAEGSKVQLDCIVRGLPMPEVRWFCEGKELENSPDIQILTDGELHSLIIAEAFEEDTGRYSCFASNFYGTDSTSAEIYVEGASSSDSEGEQPLEHVDQLKTKKTSATLPSSLGQTVFVEEEEFETPELAAATEEPTADLSSPPTHQPPLLVQTSTAVLSVPELSKASVASSAQPAQEETTTVLPVQLFPTVTQEVTEGSGDQEASASVPVTSRTQQPETVSSLPLIPVAPSVHPVQAAPTQTQQVESQTSNLNYLQGLNGQAVMAAPVFTKSLQDLFVSEGQLVVLECLVKGTPSPRVDWYREGKPMEDSPAFRILQKKEVCTLVIAEVLPEDSGVFTCKASNKYGTVSTSAALRVRGNGRNSNHVRPVSSLTVDPSRIQEPSPSAPSVNLQPEVTNSIKPHSSTIRLDPLVSSTLRLDPLNTSTFRLDPQSSSMLRPDPFRTSLPSLEPSSLSSSISASYLNSHSSSTPNLDPLHLYQNTTISSGAHPEPQSITQVFSQLKPFSAATPAEQEISPPWLTSSDTSAKVKGALQGIPNHQNGSPVVVPLPDPPPNSCLKSGTLTNHRHSRSGSRVGLHVHFKLPEDEEEEQSEASTECDEDEAFASANKGPPPVRAKPKLEPAQLRLLHNQVLMEQQQETEPPIQTPSHAQSQSHPTFQSQVQPEVPSSHEAQLWSPRMHHEPLPPSFPPQLTTTAAHQQTAHSAPPLTNPNAPSLSSAPQLNTTFSPLYNTAPTFSSPLSFPQLKTSTLVTSPPPPPQLNTASPLSAATVTQMNTIHASHLNLSPAALAKHAPTFQFSSPPAPQLSTLPTGPTLASQQIISPTPLLRSTHASLMNLTATSFTFNYTRPKEFIAAQTFSPVRSPSPTESPVPLLQELAAELNSSAASSPTLPPFSPPPRIFPTRVLMSPTSPPSLVSSPTPGSAQFPNSLYSIRAQSPPQASSPTSSSSTPSPIQNPVAFLSSVLPSLSLGQPRNSMGLPKGAPTGLQRMVPKVQLPSNENIRGSREILLQDIEKKLRFKDDPPQFAHQQEYKVSRFEQRLMSEVEFRLERTPVEESDDEVKHDDVPTGKCIAPIFDKKLKNFKAMEDVPVTFSCKVVGIPLPKVYWFKDGKQILRKNVHYKKIREGDGTCVLHIESTTSDDDGNYTVMAANPQGRISCSGHLIVQTGPPRNQLNPIHSQRVRARIQQVEGEQTQERFFRPHFLQAPGDMLAHEGRLCRLDCKVSGLPSPELMWLVNGKPIYPDLYHRLLVRENGIHSLVIDPLTQNDGGTYTCIANNKAGQSSFSLELKVVEKETKHPPQFVEKLQNMGIPQGTPVRLECRVVGMPPPAIFWKKDNDTIPRTRDRISMTQDATGYVCLLIQPTTKDDAGWYTVSAKNEAGIASCTCRLDIYAQWHQSIPAPMKKAPRTGSRYAALTDQGLDIKSAFPTSDNSPFLFSSSPPETMLESEEL